jgi:hypothetical protein
MTTRWRWSVGPLGLRRTHHGHSLRRHLRQILAKTHTRCDKERGRPPSVTAQLRGTSIPFVLVMLLLIAEALLRRLTF